MRLHVGPQTWARLPISGGISDIYKSIVTMLESIERGVYPFEISFLCSSFTARWSLSESNGVLNIRTAWTAVNGYSNGREIGNAQFNDVAPRIVVERATFVAEWQDLARRLKRDLLSAGYDDRLGGFEYLKSLE